ncbi:entericidin A/B family lipoprotein [Methylobacillus sp. Pita2]|nr:entericidin A/B family lipoprotein [Methylobacillus flagellatus]MDR5172010.1 entericidin A/B family lipoprotein [Methylobacillus flagellatus]
MKKLTAFLMLCGFIALTGCNTMKGAGQDIQRGGEKLEDSAERHK